MHGGDIAHTIISSVVEAGQRNRIISLDLETRVLGSPPMFLTGESILSFAWAYRSPAGLVTGIRVAENVSASGELRILLEINEILQALRPLVVVGYNYLGYDHPLLTFKIRRFEESGACPPLWGIRQVLRTVSIDIIENIRFELARYASDGRARYVSLETALNHHHFKTLPLKRAKSLAGSKEQRGEMIYSLWKNDRNRFCEYALGDVHDTLLLSESLFGITKVEQE